MCVRVFCLGLHARVCSDSTDENLFRDVFLVVPNTNFQLLFTGHNILLESVRKPPMENLVSIWLLQQDMRVETKDSCCGMPCLDTDTSVHMWPSWFYYIKSNFCLDVQAWYNFVLETTIKYITPHMILTKKNEKEVLSHCITSVQLILKYWIEFKDFIIIELVTIIEFTPHYSLHHIIELKPFFYLVFHHII